MTAKRRKPQTKLSAGGAATPSAAAQNARKFRALANRLHRERRLDEAITAYQAYLQIVPQDSGMWSNLGVALRQQKHLKAAAACYRRALEISPGEPGYLGNLGNVLKDMDLLDEALAAHAAAVAKRPKDFQTRYNYGVAFRDAARFEDALAQFDACIAITPDHAYVQWDRALALLHLGRFKDAWPAYEWRWKLGELKEPAYEAPPWHGEDIAGKRILLYPEQGFGDTILMSRFISLVKERGAEVILECKPPLWRLYSDFQPVDRLVEPGQAPTEFDYHCSLMGLPGIFAAEPPDVPPQPTLTVPEEAREVIRPRIAPCADRFKVGVVWSGSITFKGNDKRSVSPQRFIELANVPGVQLFSLYKGPLTQQLQDTGAGAVIIDICSQNKDFAETAALIEALDLVIMTDSAIAHLAATLGKPVWNLLCFSPYWLYGSAGETTPWYPSMRLLRQPAPGDWDSVFARLRDDLAAAVAAKRGAPGPA